MELREAMEALGGVLGRMSPDDLLGRIFSGFCIGK
jgi:tRNA modification GTPase